MSGSGSAPVRILHVDDEPDFADLAATFIERERQGFEVHTARSPTEGFAILAEEPIECIVSDYDMPETNGLEFLETIREDHPNLPFILFTGKGSEEIASEAITAGVTDYLNKGSGTDQYTVLANCIDNAVEARRIERRSTDQARTIEVIRGVTQAVVKASTRAGIEQAVCDRLVAAEPYSFAWIGEPDPSTRVADRNTKAGAESGGVRTGTGEIVPHAHSGTEAGYLDEITITTDESPTGSGPAGRAIRTGTIQVSQDVRRDTSFDPWQDAIEERGYRSVAAIPLVSGSETYGLLAAYADRPDAFDETEREVLTELGETIGHAIHAAETRDRLQEQYRELFEQAPVMYATTRNRGGEPIIEDCNERFCATLGDPHGTVVGRPLAEYYSPESTADLLDDDGYERALDGEFMSEERRLVTGDGAIVETLMRAVPRMSEAGTVVGTIVLFVDITERKRAEEVLERAEAMEASMDGMAILDPDGQYIYANEAHADIYDYDSPDAFLGESWRLCYDEEAIGDLEGEVRSALDRHGQWRGETVGRRRDGSPFPQEVSFTTLSSGELIYVVRDITERKRAENELRDEQAFIDTTLDALDDVFYVLDASGKFVRWNDRLTDVTGYADEEIAGTHVTAFVDEEDHERVAAVMNEAFETGQTSLTAALRTKSGETIPYEFRGVRLTDADGEITGICGIARDITDYERNKRRLEALHEGTREMMEATTHEEVCGIAARTSKHVLGHSITVVRLLDADGETLVPVARTGETHERIGERPAYPVGDTPAGRAYRERTPRIYDDLADLDGDELAENYDPGNARSAMYAPLGEYGVISIADTAADRFNRSDAALARVLASNAEAALDRIDHERALEALHEGTRAMMTAETPEEVGEIAIETAHDALDLPLTGLWLHDPDEDCLRPTAFTDESHALFEEFPTYTAGNSLSWEVFATGEPAIYDEVGNQSATYDPDSPIASEIIVPLGEYGVLNSGSTDVGAFSDIDVSTAQILAANTEAALERAEREALLRDRDAQLERERDRFARLFENVPDPSVVVEMDGDEPITQSVNPAFEDVFGYTTTEIVGRSLNDFIVPPDRVDGAKEIDRSVVGGSDVVREVSRQTANGERREFLFRDVVIDRQGGYEGFGIYTDITERHKAEQYRRRLYEILADTELTSEERVREMLELGSERLDLETSYLTRIEGGTQRIVEASGPHEKIQSGSECPLPRAYCRKAIETDRPLPLQHAAEAGWKDDPAYEEFGFEAYVGSKLAIDGALYGTVSFADRTPRERNFSAVELAFVDLVTRAIGSELERRQHERDLEEQKHKVEALHRVATNLVSCQSETEVYELTVDAAERILDLYLCYVGVVEGDSIVPKARSSRAGPEHARTMATDEGLAGKTLQTGTSCLIEDVAQANEAEPGQESYRSAISSPIGDIGVFQAVSKERGKFDEADLELVETLLAHVAATIERVRHENPLERQQRELERQNERLEEFASVLSHDLRNPLGVAQGNLELVSEEDDEQFLRKVRDAHDRMERIIEDVLALTRQGRSIGEKSTIDLAATAERAWGNVETRAGELSIGDDRDRDLGTIEADGGRLEALFENLFRNAIEHGGEDVVVRIGRSDKGFSIADDGPGIPVEERDQVLEHGHTTGESGTGFGLSIVETIADAHDWEIAVAESETGGARFEIRT
ncbi:hypothetical protein BRC86_05700 [Halobacteriales archaeon QS_3_64_16]|nr:MAG: hypothetical protein BRC86_05700 [Halobacteriales archaeon QS_3_64_16]